jgi:hypothetical protein
MKFSLSFTTDYGQFYLNDKDLSGDTGSDDLNKLIINQCSTNSKINSH